LIIGSIIPSQVPAFAILFRFPDFTMIFGLTLVMSVLAALLPARHVASVDPMTAFSV
jgi:ABC-type lipoprotein release transport system permease subunit